MVTVKPEVIRVNPADDCEVDVLCAHFGCERVDIYVAVAMVGDVLSDVRRHFARALQLRPERSPAAAAQKVVTSLCPAWPSARNTTVVHEE